jgi:hypothetical protein
MKSSKNFNVRSTGSDYTKQRPVIVQNDVQNDMIYVRRPTIAYLPNRSNDKKINNRFQK